MRNSLHVKGLIFVIIGASLWGIGGTASDYIFTTTPVDVNWYVTARLTVSGLILLSIYTLFFRRKHRTVWNKHTVLMFAVYSIFGMTMVQYTFMAAIGFGNAAVATVLQCTGPIYIILYAVMKKYRPWTKTEALIIISMLAGVILIATNGNLTNLAVSPAALLFGLASGIALAYYTLHAPVLLQVIHPLQLVGGSMLAGGIIMNFIHPIWVFDFSFDWSAMQIIILVLSILLGTTLAFYLYITSMKYISSTEAGILGLLEPVSAVLTSVVLLNVGLGVYQTAGIILILGVGVFISTRKKETQETS
ncbi:DMT family transporter [Jeotgalicoccus halotolerans]|uniref:EamA family transporter n=1 Tax=Jeotgalicoccus nanhaiensis TaxID=568603 RepID=A0ABR9XVG5_9STAP|nr:DMT family transporter [Jeotgalicoccus nanhaiensis]MBF0752941.1 EamA family transporter [Jeotgalicoccus nanhaiensis]TFU63097.1 EamA family transporter [Jeotgalicoccus nanhaiensis]